MLEAQACTGSMINPQSGEKQTVDEAVNAGVVAQRFKKHLVLAEMAVHGYEATTGAILPLFEAMKLGLVPQGMAYS